MADVLIDNSYYNRILRITGFPIVTKLEISEEDIKNLCIAPALEEYFIWFPIKVVTSYNATTEFSIAFPDDNTYGIVDARVNLSGYRNVEGVSNPLVAELLYNSSSRIGKYGTPYDYDFKQARISAQMEQQATVNLIGTKKIRVDEVNRVVTGYTNVGGELIITWAKFSNDFDDVSFRRRREVIKLCQANVLEYIGMLRGQISDDTGTEFNYDMLLDKADTFREDVMTKWGEMTKPVVIRS